MAEGNLINYDGWHNESRFLTGHDNAESVGFFIKNELDYNLKNVFKPLYGYSFSRDCEELAIGPEIQTTSIVKAEYRGVGSISNQSQPIYANGATAIPAVEVDNVREAYPTVRWAMSMNWTDIALRESAAVGRPITAQQIEAAQMKLAMMRDQYFYIGLVDYKNPMAGLTTVSTPYGLANAPYAYKAPVLDNTFYEMIQTATTASDALQKIVGALSSVQGAIWQQTGSKVLPNTLLIPLEVYSLLASTVVSQAGNMSIAQYLETNNIYTRTTGKPINIYGVKWLSNQIPNAPVYSSNGVDYTGAPLTQAGQKASNSPDWFNNGKLMRAIWYYKGDNFVTYPISDLVRMPIQPQGLTWTSSVWATIGHVQIAYPETIGYLDGV